MAFYVEYIGPPGSGKSYHARQVSCASMKILRIIECPYVLGRLHQKLIKLLLLPKYFLHLQYNGVFRCYVASSQNWKFRHKLNLFYLTKSIKDNRENKIIADQGYFQLFYSVYFGLSDDDITKEFYKYKNFVFQYSGIKSIECRFIDVDINQNVYQLQNRPSKKTNLSKVMKNDFELKIKLNKSIHFFHQLLVLLEAEPRIHLKKVHVQ